MSRIETDGPSGFFIGETAQRRNFVDIPEPAVSLAVASVGLLLVLGICHVVREKAKLGRNNSSNEK